MTRALALISGGLDSILAAKLIKEQGIDVIGICFKSYFFRYILRRYKYFSEVLCPLLHKN